MTGNRYQIQQTTETTFLDFGSKKFQGDFNDICKFLARRFKEFKEKLFFSRRFKEFKEKWSP